MDASTPGRPLRRTPPPRDVVLAARRARRRRESCFAASLVLGVAVGFLPGTGPRGVVDLPLLFAILLLAPGIALGLLAGRRLWPGYVPVLIIAIVFLALLPRTSGVPVTAAAVLVLGYATSALLALLRGQSPFTSLRPEADQPRIGGGASMEAARAVPLRKVTIASAQPTGEELSKRPTR